MTTGAATALRKRVAVIGPVFPYRGAISYCTTELARELGEEFDVDLVSFSRQYPKRFYPGGDDRDETVCDLTPKNARFSLDVLNPLTWIAEGFRQRRQRPDAIVVVWWVWVWAIPYLTLLAIAGRRSRLVIQCHNISDKEPARWKTLLSNTLFRRADALVVHSRTGADEAAERLGEGVRSKITELFLPVLAIGRDIPSREEAKARLGLEGKNIALFFGHIRPFKGLDIALRAWPLLQRDVTLLVAGEVWFAGEQEYRDLARECGVEQKVRFEFRFIPDSDVARYFAAADVVVAPYRHEAQSGVAMNAFYFARPVIASAVGGIPEIIDSGVNGFLVPPENPPALAARIDQFFAVENRASFERGAEASAKKYSWERYGDGVAEVVRLVTSC